MQVTFLLLTISFLKKLEDLSNIKRISWSLGNKSYTRDSISSEYYSENTTLSAGFWTKFEVSEKLMKHCVECLISKMEVKSSKSMLRPGIQTFFTAATFLVLTWSNTIELEKSRSYQQLFCFYLPLNRTVKSRKVEVRHLRSEVGLFCVSVTDQNYKFWSKFFIWFDSQFPLSSNPNYS